MNSKKFSLVSLLLASCMLFACNNDKTNNDQPKSDDPAPAPVVVEPTQVKVTNAEVTLKEGETSKIEASVLPEDATDKSLTYESGDVNVATVAADGTITAVKAGETVITVKSVKEGVKAEVKVTVIEDTPVVTVTSIKDVQTAALALESGNTQEYTIEGTVTGKIKDSLYVQDATAATYIYIPADKVASVGDKVRVTSVFTNYNGLAESPSGLAHVEVIGVGDQINPLSISNVAELTVDKQCMLVSMTGVKWVSGTPTTTASVSINTTLNGEALTLRTDKNSDADIKQGIVDKFNGITVNDSINITSEVLDWYKGAPQVKLVNATGIEIEKGAIVDPTEVTVEEENISVEVGKQAQIVASVLPENTTDKTLTYTSADETIATVSSKGVVKGIAAGTTTVTVASVKEGVNKVVNITVTEASTQATEQLYSTLTFENYETAFSISSGAVEISTGAELVSNTTVVGGALLEATDLVKVYAGANGGFGVKKDVLKLGTTKVSGAATLKFDSTIQITKVALTGWGWKNTTAISVNGSDPVAMDVQISNDVDPNTVEFDVTACSDITLATSGASFSIVLSKIEVYAIV